MMRAPLAMASPAALGCVGTVGRNEMRMKKLLTPALAALVLAGPASAQTLGSEPPQVLKRVLDCRTMTDQAERLACFDREVAVLEAATARNDLVVADRQQVRSARRTLFGLTLPNLAIFGSGDEEGDEEGVSRIETKIKSASQSGLGRWTFALEDGGTWTQVDNRDLVIDPEPGHEIKIRRAAMGSYLANVNGQIAIRVQRLR